MSRRSILSTRQWFALGLSVPLMLCSASALGARQRDNAAANAEDAARAQIVAMQEELNAPASVARHDLCDQEFRFEHLINVGDGVEIHVIERFSGRSILRFPHRALLMLPATLAANNYFDAEVEGDPSFNALHQAASRGFFGFAMSYEGFGESTLPEDGRTVTAERILHHTGTVVEWIRTHRFVPKVDVFGTSIGAGIAIAIGGTESPIDYHHINRVAIATNVYKTFTPETQAVFTPEFKAFLLGLPGGFSRPPPPPMCRSSKAWTRQPLRGRTPTSQARTRSAPCSKGLICRSSKLRPAARRSSNSGAATVRRRRSRTSSSSRRVRRAASTRGLRGRRSQPHLRARAPPVLGSSRGVPQRRVAPRIFLVQVIEALARMALG